MIEYNSAIKRNKGYSQQQRLISKYGKWKKLDTKNYTLYNSVYVNSSRGKITETYHNRSCQRQEVIRGLSTKGCELNFEVVEIFCIQYMTLYFSILIFQNSFPHI